MAAIAEVLRRRDIDRDVVLSTVDGEIQGVTPYLMITSRSYAWCPVVKADVSAARALVAPAAVAQVSWGSPDEP